MSSSSYVGGVGGGPARDYSGYFVLPAAPAQRQLWFLCQLEPNSNAAYNVVSAVRLTGRLDLLLLQRALNQVVARHESLRTGIGAVDGDPHQLVLPEALVSLPVLDLTGPSPEATEQRLRALAQEQGARPFTLDEPPLLRVVLAREAPDRHTLIVVIHHVVCDGWSMEVFFDDLAHAYRHLAEGRVDERPEPPIQYADYVAWQQAYLAEGGLRDLITYWKAALTGTLPLELPTDRPRDARRTWSAGRLEMSLDRGETSAVTELAARCDVTPFMLLLTAFKLTLARVTGQDDIAVGTPVAGRHHPDAEALVGFFANTLVLRTRLAMDAGFTQAVAAVRETCVGAFAHQRMPFDRLVEELRQTRALDRNPLFDVMFSMQNTPGVEVRLPGLTMTPIELAGATAKFDLWLTVLPYGDEWRLRLDYDSDLYDRETAAGLLDLYRTVLRQIRRDPEVPCAQLPGVTDRDRDVIERQSIGRPLTLDTDTVLDLLANRDSAEPAVASPDGVETFGGLRARSADLAARLRAEGIAGPGMVVATPPEASINLIVVALAVLEVGAALTYARRHPRDGAFVCRDAGEADGWRVTTGPRFDPVTDVTSLGPTPDGPAWLSDDGSGSPVVFSHRAITAGLASMAARLGGAPDEDVVVFTDADPVPLVDLLLPLARYRRLVFARTDQLPAAESGGMVLAAPAVWRRLLTAGWTPPQRSRLVCRGAALAPDLVAMLRRTGRPVYLGWSTSVAAAPVSLAPLGDDDGRLLGPPLDGCTRRLLDDAGQPVPVGVVGALHLAGPVVATGVPAGPDGVPTGLRCRYRRDGDLEFIGYADGRLAIGDHTVVPERIEQVLAGIDGVRCAAVVASGAGSERQLVGWLVLDTATETRTPQEQQERAAAALASAQALLPAHEVPTVFGVLPELPRTPSGAVDRVALADMRGQAMLGAVDETPPRNRLERVIIGIFQDMLPVRRFGVHADFFALGGHSLLAAKVIGRVRDELGVLVPIREFFRTPTPAGLAKAVDSLKQERNRRPAVKAHALRGQLASLADEEVEQLLRQLG